MAPVEPWFNSSSSNTSFPFKKCDLSVFKLILLVIFSVYFVVLTVGVCCDCVVLPKQHLQQEQEQEQQPPVFVPYKYSRFL